jgi:ubiquinone/menaquinone biosynthesis C-methylase UbiE
MKKKKEVKEIVRDKYAGIAVASEKDGCGCGCSKPGDLEYTVFNESYESKKGYVKEADLYLGCGIPTEHAEIREGHRVLDLGSGAGNDCFVARSIVGESGFVTGLDFTRQMVAKAEVNNIKMGYRNVEFVLGDIENIPLPDESYDVVISNCVLNLVPDKKKAFKEVHRVLKPGGHFCVSDIVLKGELPDDLRDAAALYAGCVSGALQIEEYIGKARGAGFTGLEVRKERTIEVPDEILLPHTTRENLDLYRASGSGIFSITLFGTK